MSKALKIYLYYKYNKKYFESRKIKRKKELIAQRAQYIIIVSRQSSANNGFGHVNKNVGGMKCVLFSKVYYHLTNPITCAVNKVKSKDSVNTFQCYRLTRI